MFLRYHTRIKDGKEHRYWDIVENRRCGRGQVVQRQVLYLGEINDSQRESWCRTIEVFDENRERTMPLALFPADRQLPNFAAGFGVQVRSKRWSFVGLGNGEPAGWLVIFMSSWNWMSSGRNMYPIVGRGPVGGILYKPWSAIDSLIQAANGGCIGSGLTKALWATCLHVTLRARLRPLAPGLTPRAVLDKFATMQMLDVHFPTTDGRSLILSRYTHPETGHKVLLEQLNLTLPAQPPPRISSRRQLRNHT
jgi:hypothetical protein